MHTLLSYALVDPEYDTFKNDQNQIRSFLNDHHLDGLEMLQYAKWDESILEKDLVFGLHMKFWPNWLEFWEGDTEALIHQFGDEQTAHEFYGGPTKEAIVTHFKNELEIAKKMKVHYVVFHVGHVTPEHCHNYAFDYSNQKIIEVFISMLNVVLEDFQGEFDLLFENLWWPGLTLLDPILANGLLERVAYPHKGFMLDIGHMMNTNLDLETEPHAIDYIMEKMKDLGELTTLIKGIHLHSSLSGTYVKNKLKEPHHYSYAGSFKERYWHAYGHVSKIDTHQPFRDPSIKRIIEMIQPDYLIYEFNSSSLEELSAFVTEQNQVLK